MLLFGPILSLPVAVATLIALPLIGRLILGPVNRAAGLLKAPTRFQLSDFVWLLVQLQIVLAACVQFVGVETDGLFLVLLSFWSFAVVAMWAGAVSFLSRAGVTHPWRRASFILLVLPGTLGILIGTPMLALGLFVVPFRYLASVAEGYEPFSWLRVILGVTLGALVLGAVLLFGWSLRRLSEWVAKGTMIFAAEVAPDTISFRLPGRREKGKG